MSRCCFVPLVLACAPAWAQGWQTVATHPQPGWSRPWFSLNGAWNFDFDPQNRGLDEKWFEKHDYSRQINVPFPWQSELSGIHDVAYNGVAWYEREIAVPADAGPRVFLVFGAVDFAATVWVNGQQVASHEGGYTPFEVEITNLVPPGKSARLTVRAVDLTEPDTPTGKQVGWYTPTGGIWQAVYLESRGPAYLQMAHVYPDIDSGQATFHMKVLAPEPGSYSVDVTAVHGDSKTTAEQAVDLATGENVIDLVLPVPNPALWSPDTPELYEATVRLLKGKDVVDTACTYFGMRKIGRGTYGGSSNEYILLNNKPIYLRGALHQSFNPKGIYTHPDDDFIRQDYEKAKALGLNCLRIHIKTEEPRALYWADRLGVMLMCDVPNFWKKSDRSKGLWEANLRGQILRDFNHPSIFAWVNFNETWGIGDQGYDRATQEWVRGMWALAKQLDPTRLVEDNSVCNYDHVETDINSWHFYIDQYDRARDHVAEVVEKTFPGSTFNYAEGWKQGTAPLMNSEYGGVSAGSGDRDISWVFLFLTNLLRKYDKINGYIYTELSDIEWEHNGFMNYDRSDKFYGYPAGITVADLQSADYPVLDCPPYQVVKAGDQVSLPVLLSHWSERPGLKLRLSVAGRTVDGRPWNERIPAIERPVDAAPYHVSPQGTFDFKVPNGTGLIFAVAEVLDGEKRIGANYCVVHATEGAAFDAPTQYVLTFPVEAFSDFRFDLSSLADMPHPGKVYGFKNGYIEYQLKLPKDLKPESVAGVNLIVEAGAKAAGERLDWPARTNPQDYPQTDGKAWPSDLTITADEAPVTTVTLETDFADAKGVLSHVAHWQHGSRGQVLNVPFGDDALNAVKAALEKDRPFTLRLEVKPEAAHVGGLALYGDTMGQLPLNPTLLFTLNPGTPKPEGEAKPVHVMPTTTKALIETGPAGHEWRFTTDRPADGWEQADFDDAKWSTGKSGFGTAETPGAKIGTAWDTADIWLRTKIAIPAEFGTGATWISLHHDEDVEIYVNGTLLLKRRGHIVDYERIGLSKDQVNAFTRGAVNTIAVHCHQTGGGQFVDLGLYELSRK